MLVYFRSRCIHLLLSRQPNRAKPHLTGVVAERVRRVCKVRHGAWASARLTSSKFSSETDWFIAERERHFDDSVISHFCVLSLVGDMGVSLLTIQLITHSILITATLYHTSLIVLTIVDRDWIFHTCLPFLGSESH